jgi:hypothetical protein
MALRLACHDSDVHATMSPQGADARQIFDAVEQARVESIGALRMPGMANNIRAMNTEKYAKANFGAINTQEDAPIAEAVALLVREKLTGEKPPESAGKILDVWRPFIEDKASGDLKDLSSVIEDQKAFSKLVRKMLTSMQMAEDFGDENDETESQEAESDEDQPRSNEQQEEQVEEDAGSDAAPAEALRSRWKMARWMAPRCQRTKCPTISMRIPKRPAKPAARTAPSTISTRRSTTASSPRNSTRKFTPRNSATKRSSIACAPSSTSSWRTFKAPLGA